MPEALLQRLDDDARIALGHVDGESGGPGGGHRAFGGGTLRAAFSFNTSRQSTVATAIAAGATSRIDTNNQTVTWSTALTGAAAAGLVKTGDGLLVLSGNNSYAGNTEAARGTIRAGHANAFGNATGTVSASGITSSSGAIDLNGFSFANHIVIGNRSAGPGAAGALQNTNTSAPSVLAGNIALGGENYVGGDGSVTLNGVVSGGLNNIYSLYKQGAGTWKFANTANTFDGFYYQIGGATEVTKLANINENSSLGRPTNATMNRFLFGFNGSGGGALRYVGDGASVSDRVFVMQGVTAAANNLIEANGTSETATLKLTGGLSAGRSGTYTLSLGGTNTGDNEISGAIGDGSGTVALRKEGAGRWILSGNNTYAGTTTVSNGTLIAQNGSALPNLSTVDMANLGTAQLQITHSEQVGALNGGGTLGGNISLSNGVQLTTGSNDTSTSYGGVISGIGASLLKRGTGNQTLSGENSFSGGVTIQNGTLRVSAPDAAGTYNMLGTGPVMVNSGANLTFFTGSTSNNHTYNNNINLNGATLQFEDGTTILPGPIALTGNNTFHGVWNDKNLQANGVISGTGGVLKTGDASLLMNNANTYAGDTTITGGEILIGVNPVGSVGAITSSATGRGTVRLNGGAMYSNGATARDVLNPVEVLQNSTLGDGTNNGALTLKAAVHLGGAINSPRQLTINSPVEIQNNMTGGTLVGLTKAGTSTLTLTASGGWNGDLSVIGGTFQLTGGGTLSNIGNTNVSGAGTTLRINNSAGQLRTSSITLGASTNLNLEAGTLRTNGITLAAGSAFTWGAGTLTMQNIKSGNSGSTDRSGDDGEGGDTSGPTVYEGTVITIDNGVGNTVATSEGSVLDLGELYSSGGLRYDQLRVTGTLNLSAENDTLRVAINPYLLRPSSVNSVATGDWGTLILVHADTITQKFDTVTGITNDSIGWTQLATETNSGRLPSTLGLNEWVLEYRTGLGPLAGGDALLLHYKVAGTVPEPASAGLMVAGLVLLRALKRKTAR